MANSSSTARKAAYLFLASCCIALLAFGGFRAYKIYGPSKISVGEIPYGLPAGTTIPHGDAPDMKSATASMPVQVQTEMRRGQELFRNSSYESAFEIYNGVVLLYPDFVPAIWGAVNTLLEIDSLTSSKEDRLTLLVGKLQGRYPNSGLSAYLESRTLYKSGNANSAMELAKAACEKAPTLYEARLWYGELLMKDSRNSKAIQELKAVVSLSNGDSPKAYELLAEIYHNDGHLDSCAAIVEYALSQYPVNAHLLLLRGYMDEYSGHFDAAEKIYQRILAFNPGDLLAKEALNTLGEKTPPGIGSGKSLTPEDRAQVAVDILEPLVDRYPDNNPLKEALGRAFLKGRQYDRARLQFQEIQRADPEYPDIQQRIQEANVSRNAPTIRHNGLADDLNRAVDSLREANKPSSSHDFTTMLGHYLVRYGATPKEFFKKYSITNFRPIKNNVWQETFYNAPYQHTYTVVFDSLNHFRQVHVVVFDSSSTSNHLGMAPEVYTRLLKQNSRISGIGNSTGETDCGDGLVLDAAVWETQDNFEMIARIVGKPAEVRMIRFDKSVLPPGLKLCDYVTYLNQF